MLGQKVSLTNELVALIQKKRMSNSIRSADLSEKIGKPSGYISAIENKRIKTIALPLLIKIFQVFDSNQTEEEITAQIETVVSSSSSEDIQSSTSVIDNDDNEDFEYEEKDEYNLKEDYDNPYLIDTLLKALSRPFSVYYENRQKDAVYVLTSLLESMRFDMGLMMRLLRYPYFLLNPLVVDERKAFLSDIREVFEKHLEIAQSKQDKGTEE
jgi:transcriptional regulator with XRE-family HTH domain